MDGYVLNGRTEWERLIILQRRAAAGQARNAMAMVGPQLTCK